MKKFLSLVLILLMAFTFTACGGGEKEEEPETTQSDASESEEQTEDTEEEDAEAADEADDSDAAAPSGASDGDFASAVDGSKTSDTDPVPFGEWGKATMYAVEDETYHTIYVRVNKVTTATDDESYIQSAIDLHNESSSDFSQIDVSTLNLPSDVELCVMDYEIAIPAEFPSPEHGLTEPHLMFSEDNIGGGGIPAADGASTYIGLGTNNEDLALEADPEYAPGNTYAFRTLFTMVKGYQDYVFEFTAYPDGTKETSADVMYSVYLANH